MHLLCGKNRVDWLILRLVGYMHWMFRYWNLEIEINWLLTFEYGIGWDKCYVVVCDVYDCKVNSLIGYHMFDHYMAG